MLLPFVETEQPKYLQQIYDAVIDLNQHKTDCQRFRYLKDLYEGRHPIQLELVFIGVLRV